MKKFVELSSWSRKTIGAILIAVAACMVACDDSSSASAEASAEPVSVENSSSSKKLNSSSSVIPSETKQSSSSSAKSSSSSVQKNSSSSEKAKSSSSKDEKETKASSNSVKSNSSSSVIPGNDPESSSSLTKSSSSVVANSSSSVTLATPCKTDSTDICEYGSLTDERDGRTYKTVKIGDQWWMAENLDYEVANSFCYKETVSNCAKYGRLYTWAAAMDSAGVWSTNGNGCGDGKLCTSTEPVNGVCPSGWHLPSIDEWLTLCFAVGDFPGRDLKSLMGYGTDAFGFSALLAGVSVVEGNFGGEGIDASFWSSTELGSGFSYSMKLKSNRVSVLLNHEYKFERFSVRCVKN